MSDLLFVYGSLLSGAGHENGARLAREAELIGCARFQGKLFAYSWYPVMIGSVVNGDHVEGEVYRLHAPAATLAWLDAYEGLPVGSLCGEQYERVLSLVDLATAAPDSAPARPLEAWLYLCRAPVTGLTHVVSGSWLEHIRE